ncbi:MAG: Tex-like N-terminal domain-containing protein [Collinsella sp.]
MDLIAQLARELNLKAANVEAAVKLIDEGNTIPFISRYRKEATGGMDDVACALDERCPTCAILSSAKRTSSCSSTPRASSRPSSSSRFARPRSSSASRTSTSPTARSA